MKKITGFLLFLSLGLMGVAQSKLRAPILTMTENKDGSVQFFAKVREPCSMPGRKAFFTYFYEFGDGTFSTNTKPIHRYRAAGTYKVTLCVTNNYDNCETPQIVEQLFHVSNTRPTGIPPTSNLFDGNNSNISMKFCRDPKPGDPLITYLGYRSRRENNSAGYLMLFFNNKHFFRKSFIPISRRTYHGEEIQNSDPRMSGKSKRLYQEQQKKYMDHLVFRYNNLQKGMENLIFFTMQMPADLKTEIHQWISMTAVMLPDNPAVDPEKFDMGVKVTGSYDPNQLLLEETLIGRRIRKKKELNYQVRFENLGDGPARQIAIAVHLSKQLKNAALKIKGISPVMTLCNPGNNNQRSCVDTFRRGDSIHFIMKEIHLSGREEKSTSRKDTTGGFIDYSLHFEKRLKKKRVSSRAVIVFDNNEPVVTNTATARFVRRQGIVAGYEVALSNGNYSARGPIRIGYVLTPNAASRLYYQFEAYLSVLQREDLTTVNNLPNPQGLLPDSALATSSRTESTLRRERQLFQFVPLHFRYHFNNWISLGAGIMGQLTFSEKNTLKQDYYIQGVYGPNSRNPRKFDTLITRTIPDFGSSTNNDIGRSTNNNVLSKANITTFGDLQVGRIRSGTILGIRFFRQLDGNVPNRFFVYAGFKL